MLFRYYIEALDLLEEIEREGEGYRSAIELSHKMDGEEWFGRVSTLLERIRQDVSNATD